MLTNPVNLDTLLSHVHRIASQAEPLALDAQMRSYLERFEAAPLDAGADLNVFTFHVRIPESHRYIQYVDVQHDHHEFDYHAICRHFVRSATAFNPKVRIYFVTDLLTPAPSHPQVTVVRLPLDPTAPMYERVRAMSAYVHSRAYARQTAFLDTDAFPNCSLSALFDGDFDLALTVRPTEGFYMPLNEGVLLSTARRPDAVRNFFARYLATYEKLIADPLVGAYYGNITRWRGGQLSLNAVASALGALEARADCPDDIRVRIVPCDTHNFWVIPGTSDQPSLLDGKFILHLKGDSKHGIASFINYHVARLERDGQLASLANA